VNVAKAAFRAIRTPLKRIRMRVPVKGNDGPTKAISVIRVILRNIQRSGLNLLAAYRKIPILGVPPVSITYTRARTRAVYRKSIDELYQLLTLMEGPAAAADRARLSTLGPKDKYLAITKLHYDNIRANVTYSRLDTRGRGRVQLAAELPLLYTAGRWPTPPRGQLLRTGRGTRQPTPPQSPNRARGRAVSTIDSRLSIRTRLRDSPMPIARSARANVLPCHQFGFLKRNRNWSV
jgi:hypothetical protein